MYAGVISWILRLKESVFVVKSQIQIPSNILEIGAVQSKSIDFLPRPKLIALKKTNFILLYADVISTIMQETRNAWSAILNNLKNNQTMRMKSIFGGDETD